MSDYGFDSCKNCGNSFKLNRKWQEFCSTTCKNRFHNERRRKALELLEKEEGNKDG